MKLKFEGLFNHSSKRIFDWLFLNILLIQLVLLLAEPYRSQPELQGPSQWHQEASEAEVLQPQGVSGVGKNRVLIGEEI